jgi:glycerol-3-phosphate dehydrogenase (NAD(P)+)
VTDPSKKSDRPIIAVLGNGGWGTALALVAHRNGADTRLWGIEAPYVAETAKLRENPRYLPGIVIPDDLLLTSSARAACDGAELILCVVPTQFVRPTLTAVAGELPAGTAVLSCSKGVEEGTLMRPTEIVNEITGPRPLAVLSGPNHAEEVALGRPATAVVASADPAVRNAIQSRFSDPGFRLYGSDDVVGVELAAAVKNVVAIAAGILDGLELGDNAKAALITRGAVEISRLGAALGARTETFSGLAGIGDLIATCVSSHGRNRRVGERLGRGERLEDVLGTMVQVAEGVATTKSLVALSARAGVEMPICEVVHRILFEGLRPRDALHELMTRELRQETDS